MGNRMFGADIILRMVMYGKKKKNNKLTTFAIIDFLFQMSMIGDILYFIMFLLREISPTNILFVLLLSAISGVVSAYFDLSKIKNDRIQLTKKSSKEGLLYGLIIVTIIAYIAISAFLVVTKVL